MNTETEYEYGSLINAAWQAGGDAFITRNPARPDHIVGAYSIADADLVRFALDVARRAQREWGRVPAPERTQLLLRFVEGVEGRVSDLARAITLEQGKPLAEAQGEVMKSCAEARAMAARAYDACGTLLHASRPDHRIAVMRRPRGVIAAVTPWNFPVLTPMRKIAPAVLFGNAMVLKPSEYTPAAACILAEVATDVFPAGVVQLVQGEADTAAALVASSGVDGITFTGSVAVGRAIQRAAAANLAELSLELGGKNAAVIHDTEDLDSALDHIVGAAFMCAGQRCTAISRVIVRRALYEQVQEGLVSRAQAMVVGDGMTPGVHLGPLTHERQHGRVQAMVRSGLSEGARLLTGGACVTPAGAEEGYFFAPTVLADVRPTMAVAREEIFGPVLSVLAYDSLDDGIAILNDVEYGLTSAFFSNDARAIDRFVQESQNGMLHINHGTVPDNHAPFGGIKSSGVGAYSVGASGQHFYTTEHTVYWHHG